MADDNKDCEYIYTDTDADLSVYDQWKSFNPEKTTIGQVMHELQSTCVMEKCEVMDTDAIHGLPRMYCTFRCPKGTMEKYRPLGYGIFRSKDSTTEEREQYERHAKALSDFNNQASNCYCVVC